MTPSFRNNNPVDVAISKIVGLETYKALYALWPNLYAYISDPLVPTRYFTDLVSGVVASSGLSYEVAGLTIKNTLSALTVENSTVSQKDIDLVSPLIDSSFKIENLKNTFWENVIWIVIVVFLSFWVLWYLYMIGFWSFIFNNNDGLACYNCKSIFDIFIA